MLASLGVGPLLDDFGKKAGLILGLGLIFLVLLALPRSSGYRSIVFLLFLLGWAAASSSPAPTRSPATSA